MKTRGPGTIVRYVVSVKIGDFPLSIVVRPTCTLVPATLTGPTLRSTVSRPVVVVDVAVLAKPSVSFTSKVEFTEYSSYLCVQVELQPVRLPKNTSSLLMELRLLPSSLP